MANPAEELVKKPMIELSGIAPFALSHIPKIIFGAGQVAQLIPEILGFGKKALLITGAHSFSKSQYWRKLQGELYAHGVEWVHHTVEGEPTPKQIDEVVAYYFPRDIEVVVGVGGGSAMDAAKAVAGLLGLSEPQSIVDYLEGVGAQLTYPGPSLPLILVPTTAGTGSELTKNAVITQHGLQGYKKSFRDDQLLAKVAIVDPDFLLSCPREVMVANAMDALTQLIESYVSPRANPVTRALVESGLSHFNTAFSPEQEETIRDYSGVSYAAMLSGLCLAQTGLGAVHGMASPLGAYFSIPHGMVCGILLAQTTASNINALSTRDPKNRALEGYMQVATLLGCENLDELVSRLLSWQQSCGLKSLSDYGVSMSDIPVIVAASGGNSMKTNPIKLSEEELAEILTACL